jgi:hypothetical protein
MIVSENLRHKIDSRTRAATPKGEQNQPEASMRIEDVAYQEVGLLDQHVIETSRFAPGVITVRADEPALEIALKVDVESVQLVLVTRADKIIGVLAPQSAFRRIARIKGSNPRNLADAIAQMLADPQEVSRGFHHEVLNLERPELFVCNVGPHYTDEWPCRYHSRL